MFDIRHASPKDLDEINRRAKEFREQQKAEPLPSPEPETDFKVTFHEPQQPELPL